ncbi:hypothetical protein ACQP3D_27025, partial [Escherichia coli]
RYNLATLKNNRVLLPRHIVLLKVICKLALLAIKYKVSLHATALIAVPTTGFVLHCLLYFIDIEHLVQESYHQVTVDSPVTV